MIFKLSKWLVVALVGGALLAGCGSSKSTTSASTAAAGTSTAAVTSVVGQRAVATCERSVKAQGKLSAGTTAKLDRICEKATSGSPATLKQVAHETCVELVNTSQLPVPKEQALALCSKVK